MSWSNFYPLQAAGNPDDPFQPGRPANDDPFQPGSSSPPNPGANQADPLKWDILVPDPEDLLNPPAPPEAGPGS